MGTVPFFFTIVQDFPEKQVSTVVEEGASTGLVCTIDELEVTLFEAWKLFRSLRYRRRRVGDGVGALVVGRFVGAFRVGFLVGDFGERDGAGIKGRGEVVGASKSTGVGGIVVGDIVGARVEGVPVGAREGRGVGGAVVGAKVGRLVGAKVGRGVGGAVVGNGVGKGVGGLVVGAGVGGLVVGAGVGFFVGGLVVGARVGASVGDLVVGAGVGGEVVGESVGGAVGNNVGDLEGWETGIDNASWKDGKRQSWPKSGSSGSSKHEHSRENQGSLEALSNFTIPNSFSAGKDIEDPLGTEFMISTL
jgi:hypothetical protein